MTAELKKADVNGNAVEVLFSRTGFGGTFRCYTERPYAVRVNGKTLANSAGTVRTFGSREAAMKCGKAFAATLPAVAPVVHPCG